ncbi:dihydrofolate reductase [Candidatus Saccharibacteria bacterium]|nr:dihydrofolate reductase [Candidatus Saccharibacteria bacterium]
MISLIVAVTENDVIGNKGDIPWYLPADLAHFQQTTMGHPVIMGRKTHESIGRALPGRYNVVITRQKNYQAADSCRLVHSIEETLNLPDVKTDSEVFIIGGAEIYNQALPLADRIYLTRIHTRVEGDTFFKFDESKWQEISHQQHKADTKNPYDYDFTILERKK